MTVGVIALVVVLLVVGVAATVLRAREGRITPGLAAAVEPDEVPGGVPGETPAETTLTDGELTDTLVEGQLRGGKVPADGLPDVIRAAIEPRAAVTLVQLSTTSCAVCGPARALFTDFVRRTPGVAHAEVDITERIDVARTLHVLRTPTTLALDPRGRELFRISGMPKPAPLQDAVRPHLARRPQR